jgi:predicted O-linked N-acetylglucosamine transferase (SPINDLY family)
MAGYNQVDIALDTSPYNGTTTTCEALLMGVPVITLAGDLHISRVGVSLLTAIGHPEWIANNVNDYLQCAALTAQTRPRTKAMRETLSSEFKSSIICQNKEQSKRFSEALTQLWITWCSKST